MRHFAIFSSAPAGGTDPTTASAVAHASSGTSLAWAKNSASTPSPAASRATGWNSAGMLVHTIRIVIASVLVVLDCAPVCHHRSRPPIPAAQK